jgi:hypothetical protein
MENSPTGGCLGQCSKYCALCEDSMDCSKCVSGAIMQPNGQCTPYIPFCSLEDVKTQPGNLPVSKMGTYHCKDGCNQGYFWNEFTCESCKVRGCASCEWDSCKTCMPGLMLQADGNSCVPYFEGCNVPIKIQPEGLPVDRFGKYFCEKCNRGYFWN